MPLVLQEQNLEGGKVVQKGIDLSKWNGNIDFSAVVKDGVEFVLLREGYGHTTDSMFHTYANQCMNRGIPILGIYHFSYALTEAEAILEARKAVKNVKEAGLPDDTIIFFDYEYDSVRYAKDYGYKPTKKTCTQFTKAFCEEVKAAGYRAGVYYNVDFEKNWYEKGFLENYIRWVADWRDDIQHPEAAIHQYGSRGFINGITGNVDVDYYWPERVKMEVNSMSETERIAREVLAGKWGNGAIRRIRLTAAGYNYNKVQAEVNRILREEP